MKKMNNDKYGILFGKDIKLFRFWFNELVKLQGIYVWYRTPKLGDKYYTEYTEAKSNEYTEPKLVGCIFTEHPDQSTLKKMGWVSELQEGASIIHLPYDLQGLQKDSLITIPSGIDGAEGRVFRVIKMTTIMVYPASIACEVVPEYTNTFSDSDFNHSFDNFDLLSDEGSDIP